MSLTEFPLSCGLFDKAIQLQRKCSNNDERS